MSGYRIEELAPGVYARIGGRPLEPNSGIIVGDDGVILIDTAYSPAAARDIKADIARITPRPITTVIISHHHFDHAWGNQVFVAANPLEPRMGARIIGHANARAAMQTDPAGQVQGIRDFGHNVAPWYGITQEELNRQLDEVIVTPPDATYTDAVDLWLGDRQVQLRYFGPGHTYGDTFVYLPAERLLFAGDMVCNHLIPVVGDGDPFSFARVLDQVAGMDLGAIVPGHGPLAGRQELGEFAACLRALCDEVMAARAAGAPNPRAASEHVHLSDFAGWHGREMLPASVRRIFRALEAAGT